MNALNTLGYLMPLALIPLLYYLFAVFVRMLAVRNLFSSLVEEPTAKAILQNGRFSFFVMAKRGDDFLGPPTPGEPEDVRKLREKFGDIARWEIVKYDPARELAQLGRGRVILRNIRRSIPLLKNIKWIGLPPFAEALRKRFSWTSLEERKVKDEKGVEIIKKTLHFEERVIDYINLQEDVYASVLETVECADNIPLDTTILVGGYIVNPYKALFGVEQWLEATLNLVGARTRDFFGERTFLQLREIVKKGETQTQTAVQESHPIMHAFFKAVIEKIRDDWGFQITFIRIYSINPGSLEAQNFIRAMTQVYVAEQRALANEADGRGLASRDRQHFEAIAGVSGAIEAYKWKQIAASNLTTYVEGGGAIPAIPVGGQGPAPRQPQAGDPAPQEPSQQQ